MDPNAPAPAGTRQDQTPPASDVRVCNPVPIGTGSTSQYGRRRISRPPRLTALRNAARAAILADTARHPSVKTENADAEEPLNGAVALSLGYCL